MFNNNNRDNDRIGYNKESSELLLELLEKIFKIITQILKNHLDLNNMISIKLRAKGINMEKYNIISNNEKQSLSLDENSNSFKDSRKSNVVSLFVFSLFIVPSAL